MPHPPAVTPRVTCPPTTSFLTVAYISAQLHVINSVASFTATKRLPHSPRQPPVPRWWSKYDPHANPMPHSCPAGPFSLSIDCMVDFPHPLFQPNVLRLQTQRQPASGCNHQLLLLCMTGGTPAPLQVEAQGQTPQHKSSTSTFSAHY